jgi:hypothetical protein
MSAFLDDAARASLTVAVALLLFAAVARGLLWARIDDARAQRLARQYMEPLGTWCLVALGVHLFAVGAGGDLSVGALAPALAVGAAAALLMWAGDDAAAPTPARTPAPPEPAPASPPPASLWATATTAPRDEGRRP